MAPDGTDAFAAPPGEVAARTDASGAPQVADVVRQATRRLRAAGCEAAALDAELLVGHVLDLGRAQLRAFDDRAVTVQESAAIEALVTRREAAEPVQYILGTAWFRRLTLAVDRRVLVPRPETELLVELAVAHVVAHWRPGSPPLQVLDLCTGSGAVALAIADEAPDGSVAVTATDLSPDAIDVARSNAERHALHVELHAGSLYEPVAAHQFDIVVANPPYVAPEDAHTLPPDVREHEPHLALFGPAGDAVALHRRIARGAADGALRSGGLLAVEIGAGQHGEVAQAFVDAGLAGIGLHPDLAGHVRVVTGTALEGME